MEQEQLLPLSSPPNNDTPITFIVAEKFRAWDFLDPRQRVTCRSTTLPLSDHIVSPPTNPISTQVGLPEAECLLGAVLHRALTLPAWSDAIFVCVLMSDSDDLSRVGSERFDMKFTVVYGVKQQLEDQAVCWDLLDGDKVGPAGEVLGACKAPIPCLRKVAKGKGESCGVCSVEVGDDDAAASTSCTHVFHSCCIVNRLTKRSICPSCFCPLHLDL